jgi:hypothetical protein
LITARVLSRTPIFVRMFDTWFLTVPSATKRALAISRFEKPLATSELAVGRRGDLRALGRQLALGARCHQRSDHRGPRRDLAHRIDESLERHVLEQKPARARANDVECGRIIIECRQDQRRRQKLAPPKLADDPHPVAARHAHVEEQYVGTRIDDDAHGLGPVLGFADK